MGEPARTPAEVLDEFFGPALFTPGAQMLIEDAAPQPGERVLDLACGTGTLVRHVAPLVGPRGSVVGLDINPGMLAVAQARTTLDGTRVEWREGDAAALDLADRSFDLILCQQDVCSALRGGGAFPRRPVG